MCCVELSAFLINIDILQKIRVQDHGGIIYARNRTLIAEAYST